MRQRWLCFLAFLLVVAGTVAGLTWSIPQPAWQPATATLALNARQDLWVIASHNLGLGLRLLLGCISLGLYGVLQLFTTGLALGLVIKAAGGAGVSLWKVTALLAPHGLPEFAGLILLGAIEFEAAYIAYRKLRYDEWPLDRQSARCLLWQALWGLALIAVAALIEVFVMGPLTKRLL
jgi:uncharacterized membrane protein SpoIIM required for sporulation